MNLRTPKLALTVAASIAGMVIAVVSLVQDSSPAPPSARHLMVDGKDHKEPEILSVALQSPPRETVERSIGQEFRLDLASPLDTELTGDLPSTEFFANAEPEEPDLVVDKEKAVQKLAQEWTDYTGLMFTEADKQAIYRASVEWETIYDQLEEAGSTWEQRSPYLEEIAILKAIGIARVVFEIEDHTKLFTYFNEDSIRLALEPTYPDEYRALYAKYGDL